MDTLIVAEKLESLFRCLARIDWEVVHSIAARFLEDFRRFASEVSRSSGLA